ncbi:hypothetical protein C8R47DRAFT_958430, partial [Mycena vitilis]
ALNEDRALVSEYFGAYLKTGLVGGDEGGQVYFAENEDKEIVGVTVWFPPEQRAAGWNQLLGKLSKETQAWWALLVYDDFVASESVLGPEGFANAFHLQLIAIHPDYQRR